MDATNTPSPANPNAQDQFVIAVQSSAVQNQAQGPAVQLQVQGPVNNNAPVGQNIPMQPPQQLPQHNPGQLVQ